MTTEIEKPTYEHAKKLDVSKNIEEYAAIKDQMAMKYEFELDPFQQQAVCCMERGDSVFVAAHTSAGKTVVAEYAVALCKKNGTRVIYTSPIKALSNQKFRDFKKAFDDVGLITGDIQLHSDANCLIMTTEILKSMLYNGSEVVRELEWVIFDEVHYINDIERGHVWEEVLIMLPPHVKIVMLSATVPNCMEFADWVGRIKKRQVYVIQTLKRPVPLEHHLYTGQDGKTKKDMFCIFKDGNFLTTGYQKAVEAKDKLKNAKSHKIGAGPPRRGGANYSGPINKNNKNIYINLISHLNTNNLLPMIVFIFSRQRCDETAQLLQSVDLTSADEKSAIHRFFNHSIDRLKGTDKQLPQVLLMQEHCKRGFAVHHSGILPIIKEVIELLFQQGLVKILFATETFAMGVNMPARTVVFDTIEKHDGKERRLLNSTEYVQMAGRAGRRGLDTTGTVIIVAKGDTPPDIASLTTVLKGKPIKLESKFRMTYSMMLNLLRVEHMTIEDMLQSSYVERASLRMVVGRKDRLKQIGSQIAELAPVECAFCHPQPDESGTPPGPSLPDYCQAVLQYYDELSAAWTALLAKSREAKLFSPGRVLIIHHDPLDIVGRLAVILKTRSVDTGQFLMTLFVPTMANSSAAMNGEVKQAVYEKALGKEERKWRKEALLLGHAVTNGVDGIERLNFHQSFTSNGTFTILDDIGMDSLMAVCKRTIAKLDSDAILEEHKRLNTPSGRSKSPDRSVRKILLELDQLAEKFASQKEAGGNQFSDLVYLLGDDMERKEIELVERLKKVREMHQRLVNPEAFPCTHCSNIRQHLNLANEKRQLEEIRRELVYKTSAESLMFSGEYAGRIKVLRTLGYIDRQNMVSLKGKVACEISNQELLITELILENKFNDRSAPEIASMLSALTCQFDGKIRKTTNGNGRQNSGGKAQNGKDGKCGGGEEDGPPKEQQQQTAPLETQVERVPRELLKELEKDLVEAAIKIDTVQRECKVSSMVLDELKFGLMEVVHQWASGMEFAQIMSLSDAQEGIIVRCIQRLDEVCKDVRKAALIVGSPELAQKMEETSEAIRRDIVFAASLYVTED